MYGSKNELTLSRVNPATTIIAVLFGLTLALTGSSMITGQLLSDSGHHEQMNYYIDQSSMINGDDQSSQVPITYWTIKNELQQPINDNTFGYQTLKDYTLNEQLLEKLNELKRQALILNSNSNNNINDNIIKEQEESDEEVELHKISPPINNPLEFEATAKILQQLPFSITNNNHSSLGDLISLDTLLSTYLNDMVKEVHDEKPKATPPSPSQSSSLSGIQMDKDGDNNNIATSEEHKKATKSNHRMSSSSSDESGVEQNSDKQQQDTTPPASRYGSAEYIDHPLAIIGHQYVQGGAGEGKQLLGPDGTFENVQVVKTDHAVPSYCDPPNPCPMGFTAEDGCLENFINSASSSREYQAKQQCSCDNEHSLFNCASPISTLKNDLYSTESNPTTTTMISNSISSGQRLNTQKNHQDDSDDDDNRIDQSLPDESKTNEGKLETLARTIQNRFGSLSSIQNLIANHNDNSLVD